MYTEKSPVMSGASKTLTVDGFSGLNSTHIMWEDKDERGKRPSEQVCGTIELKANISRTTEVTLTPLPSNC